MIVLSSDAGISAQFSGGKQKQNMSAG